MAKQTLAITAQDLFGGIAPSLRVGLPGQYSPQSRGVDFFRSLGGVSAGYYAKPIGGSTVTDLIKWFVPGTGTASGDSQYLYGYGDTGKIYRIGQSDETVTLIRSVGSSTGEGLERYAQSGVMYIFYARTTDIGRSDSTWNTGASYTDNYWTGTLGKSALSSTNPHPLKAFLTNLYVADGNVIHELNGTTVTTNKITLPSTQTIVQMEATETELVMLTRTIANGSFVGNAKLYFWDGISTRYTHVTELSESAATAIINVGGSLYACMGSGVKYLANVSSGVQKVATLPASALPVPGGLSARNGVLYAFCAGTDNSGHVLSLGSPYTEVLAGLHNPAVTAMGTANQQTGALMAINNNNIIAGYYDGSTYSLIRWASNYSPNCSLATITLKGDTIRNKDWDTFKFYFSRIVADESLKFYYAIDGGDWVAFNNPNPSYAGYTTLAGLGSQTFADLGSATFLSFGLPLSFWQIEQNLNAHEFQLKIEFIPSQDYSLCPVFYGVEMTHEPIRE